jgi:uncharacterized protein|tara:strand:- start:126 stop:674 length:549 start_codon:yes stop_codon:yes gene_type:complete
LKDFKAVTHPPYVRLIGDKMYSKFMPAMDKSLGALSHLLTKAENHCTAHKIDEQALLGFRLFPDMFPMTRQVQLTCDFGARTAARLAGVEPQSFADVETTFNQLQERIKAARAYMADFKEAEFNGAETRAIVLKMRSGEKSFTGSSYLQDFSTPQFYFHMTTVYNILRHNGVTVGKRDFMGA